MDEDDGAIFMQEEEPAAGTATVYSSGQGGGYKQRIINILQSINEEIDKDSLDDLKLVCQTLSLDADTTTQLLSKKRVVEIFNLLLVHLNNDLRQLILVMNTLIPQIVKDFQQKEMMEQLSDTIIRENEVFAFSKESTLHGRSAELNKLLALMDFEKAVDTRVVNICGMTGIGKSFLVKHFGSRLLNGDGPAIIYVDVSGVQTLHDMHLKILESSGVNRSASSNADVMGTIYNFLLENKDEKFVMILDDLSSLMSNSDKKQTNVILSWIIEFTKRMEKLKVKLKMVVTSQIRFEILQERLEVKEWLTNKKKMADFTKDIPLEGIPTDVAKKFLGSSVQSLSEKDKEHLVKLCDGHPYSLHVMGAMASAGFTVTTEISKISSADVSAINAEVADALFPKAFERLNERQKLVLFAVALFDRDAQFGALYYILNPNQSSQQFYEQMKEDFTNSFWLTFRACTVKSLKEAPKRKMVANMHHSLIMKYIRNQIDLQLASKSGQHNAFIQLKKRYILYHINELVKIGKECVPDEPSRPDYLRSTNMGLMQNRANFRLALTLIQKSEDPSLLFRKNATDPIELKECSDIAYLFLCFYQYHDWFDGTPVRMLENLVSKEVKNDSIRILLWALYVMVLAVAQNWRTLDNILRRSTEENNPQLLRKKNYELYSFCQAIYDLSAGVLYTHAPFYRERKDAPLVDKRASALANAMACLNSQGMSDNWRGVRNYFSVQVLLVRAEATWLADTSNVEVIKQAFEFCKQARDLIQQAVILEPVVYSELASYQAIEGDQYEDVETASGLYEEAKKFHIKVNKLYETCKMEKTSMAAKNYNGYAVLMRSWANLLTEHHPVPDDYQVKALTCLKQAVNFAIKSTEIYEVTGSCSKNELMKSLFDTADSFERLQFETPKSEMVSRVAYQTQALIYYNKVYNLIKNDYRGCNISANNFTLNRLIERLPQLMTMHGLERELIDKVKSNLVRVREDAVKEEQSNLNLSGSDKTDSSSDQDSVDEMFVGDTDALQLDDLLALPIPFMPLHAVQTLVLEGVQPDTSSSSDLPPKESEATSSKRPKK